MKTISEIAREVGSSVYFGDNPDWIIAAAQHRDSDCLTRSNYRVMEKQLRAHVQFKNWTGDDAPVQIERFSHWAVGWIDYLIIDPAATELVAFAETMREQMEERYPVLDDEDFSNLEQEEADSTWLNCYRSKERIDYIRKHRNQFEFRGFADLLACIRGNYFAGYASELLT